MVGRNLKRLRQRAGLTQDALAERLHVTRQAVSSWETGKTAPDVETLMALAEALEVDVRALIYGPEVVAEGGYPRFQRRYVVCTAVFAAMTLALLVMEMTLKPYLHQLKGQTFILWPSLTYIMAVVPLGYAAAGALVPSLLPQGHWSPHCCRCGRISGYAVPASGGFYWWWACWHWGLISFGSLHFSAMAPRRCMNTLCGGGMLPCLPQETI